MVLILNKLFNLSIKKNHFFIISIIILLTLLINHDLINFVIIISLSKLMILIQHYLSMDTVKFELHLRFVVFFGELKIKLVLFYKSTCVDFLMSTNSWEFPVNDTNFVLISENQIKSFKNFFSFFSHPFFWTHNMIIVLNHFSTYN